MNQRSVMIARWFLAITYGITAPLTAALEFHRHLFSQRFDIPPSMLYVASATQALCVPLLFSPRWASRAAWILTVVTVVSIGGHLRIGSPQTAIGAVVFTAVQVWFGVRVRQADAATPSAGSLGRRE